MVYLVSLLLLIPLVMLLFATVSGLISIFGAPFVPAPHKIVDQILFEMGLKPGQLFVDLGSGDGWVVRRAVRLYGVKGLGIELNPFLYLYSQLVVIIFGIKNCRFCFGSYLAADLAEVSAIYVYPIPAAIPAWRDKISRECRAGTLVASFRFAVSGWDKLLVKEISCGRYSAYVYRIRLSL